MSLNYIYKTIRQRDNKLIFLKDCLPPAHLKKYSAGPRTKKKTKIAVLPIGYWDGYDRLLSNSGQVLVHGKHCPIRGRICMNLTMVDVSGLANIKTGDEVVLVGSQGKERIRVEEIAHKTGTINYEVVTRINPLIPRIYI